MGGVTVITPTIPERASFLKEMLADWHAQTVPPDEHRVGIDYQRRGPAIIRNELCENVETEWLSFADDDDRFDPNHLETLLDHSTGADVIWTFPRVVGETTGWGGPDHRCPPDRGQIPVTVLMRTALFKEVGGFPPGFGAEDEAMFEHCYDAGARFRCCHVETWTYVFHESNRSRVGV
jgi:hypothetical protein